MQANAKYETVIGLEIHAQLLTRSKLFCGDSTVFGAEPNTQVSAISLAHPGTLPRLNKEVIPLAIKLGLALNCEIVKQNYFARKNYFYPDLPKGYQVSQHTTPVCRNGKIEMDDAGKKTIVRINRIHMEEDAGKTIHHETGSYIDYNRSGMPLLEIVTEPDIRSAAEAHAFVGKIRKIVRKLGVCDGNMEEGSFRCDVNISVRKKGEQKLGTRVEIKNLNSLRFIRNCILFEEKRLMQILEDGKTVIQETRGYNEKDGTTYSIRRKEDEEDYRYFPEPDLPPFTISESLIEEIKKSLPPDEEAIKNEIQRRYGLTEKDALALANEEELYQFFKALAQFTSNKKPASNWVLGPVRNYLNQNDLATEQITFPASSLATIIDLVEEGKLNYGTATQKVFPALATNPELNIIDFIQHEDLMMDTSIDEMEVWIKAALEKYPQKITEYKKGKKGLISLFVGEVMKLSRGKADAGKVTDSLLEKLNA